MSVVQDTVYLSLVGWYQLYSNLMLFAVVIDIIVVAIAVVVVVVVVVASAPLNIADITSRLQDSLTPFAQSALPEGQVQTETLFFTLRPSAAGAVAGPVAFMDGE